MPAHRFACVAALLALAVCSHRTFAHGDLHGDPLPDGALARIGSTRLRQCDRVQAMQYSPDGKLLVSRSEYAVYLWEAATGKRLRVIEPAQSPGPVWFLPDSKTLCVASGNHVQWLDVATGKETRKLALPEHASGNWLPAPDGARLFHQGDDECFVLDLATGEKILLTPRDAKSVNWQAIWVADKKVALLCTNWENIREHVHWLRLWDVGARTQRHFALGKGPPENYALGLAGPLGEKCLAIAGAKAVRYIDWATGREIGRLDPGVEHFRANFSPDGATLAMQLDDNSVQLMDTATQKKRGLLRGISVRGPLAYAPDNRTIAAVNAGVAQIGIWDTATGKALRPTESLAHAQPLGFTPDGKTLIAQVGNDVQLWDAATGRPLGKPHKNATSFWTNVLSPDGKRLVSESASTWTLLDLNSMKRTDLPRFSCAAFAPDGKLLATGDRSGVVTIRAADDGKKMREFTTRLPASAHANGIQDLDFSHDSRFLAVANGPDGASLWDVASGTRLHQIGLNMYAGTIRAAPDTRSLVVGLIERGSGLSVVEVAAGKERFALKGYKNWHNECAFSPAGRLLATTQNHAVVLWDLGVGLPLPAFAAQSGEAHGPVFSPDGKRVAAGYADGTILIWDVESRRTDRPGPKLSPKEMDSLWKTLRSDDAEAAYQAMCKLTASPAQSVAFLRERLPPVPHGTGARLARRVVELNSGVYVVREKAFTELRAAGDQARPMLERAKAQPASLEFERRVGALLAELRPISPDTLRAVRTVEVLELMRTPDACRHLEALADGCPESRLTGEARASLRRIAPPTDVVVK